MVNKVDQNGAKKIKKWVKSSQSCSRFYGWRYSTVEARAANSQWMWMPGWRVVTDRWDTEGRAELESTCQRTCNWLAAGWHWPWTPIY